MIRAGLVAAALLLGGAPVTVTGAVHGGSGKHPVVVALWDAPGFLKKPLQTVRLEAGQAAGFHFDVAPGRYAVSAFEDQNGNGVLDMGMFGPKEPTGFSVPFHAWRAPRFDEVSFAADQPAVANVELH